MKKRILSIALCLVMLITLLPVTALAEEPHTHCVCGSTECSGDGHNASTSWTAWNNTDYLPGTDGVSKSYYLTEDVTLGADWKPTAKWINLCLNGHQINLNGHIIAAMEPGKSITITDCNSTNKTYTFKTTGQTDLENSGLWVLDPEATGETKRTVTGGIITGGKGFAPDNGPTRLGGAVYIHNYGTFTLQGGTLVGNQARDAGGAVYMNQGTFNMYGGAILGNVSEGGGGGVFGTASATFNMTQGTISGNTSYGGNGGGIMAEGTFNISGKPVITGNKKGSEANNVYLPSGKTMTVNGNLTAGANIGVSIGTTLDANTVSATVASFNDGVTVAGTKSYFTKDDDALQAEIFESGSTVKIGLPSYDVTFNTNGGSGIETQTILSGKKASEPFFNPTKEDHSFVGWYADEELTQVFNFDTAITKATTIYAKWKENTYSIDLKLDDASVDNIAFPDASVLNTEASITFKLHNTGDAEITDVNASLSGANADKFTLTFNTQDIDAGASTDLILSAKENLEEGTYAATLTIEGNKGDPLIIPVSLTVTAKDYSIILDPNDGSDTSDAVTVIQKADTNNTVPPGSRTGYTFDGWFTAAIEGEKVYDAEGNYVVGPYWDVDGKWVYNGVGDSLNLYAHWTANTYTVTFNPAGGTVNPTSKTVTFDADYLELPTPERSGYTFGGWFTLENGGGVQIKAGDTVEITSDIELFAKWEAIPATAPTVEGSNLTLTYGYTEGSINVTATPADGHTITAHQWYSNNTASNENGTLIPDVDENSYAIPTGKNAGTYYYYCVVTTKRTDNNETTTKTSDVITVTIDKKTLAVPTVTGSYTYDGELKTATINGFDENTMTKDGNLSGTNAGSYTITFGLKDTTNYMWANGADGSVTWNIDKATGSVSAPTAKSLEYTGEAQDLISAGSSTTGEIQYSLNGETYNTAIPDATNAGGYTVYYKVVGDANHNDVAAQSITVNIAKANITPTVTMADWTYGTAASNPQVGGNSGDGAVTYAYKVQGANDDTYSETKPTAAGNYTVKAEIAETDNYNGGTATADFTINKAAAPDITWPTASAVTYGQTLAESTLSGGSTQYGSFAWENSTAVPTGGGTGYSVIFTANADTQANYETITPTAKDVAVTVNKATPVITLSGVPNTARIGDTISSVTATINNPYNNALSDFPAVTLTYRIGSGEETAFTDSFTIPADMPSNTTITVKAAAAGNAFYTEKTAEATITVNATPVTHTGTDAEITYNGGTYDVAQMFTIDTNAGAATYAITGGTGVGTLDGSVLTVTSAGTFIIKLTTDLNAPYAAGEVSATLTVHKATVTVTAKDQSIYVGQDAPDLSSPVEDTHYTVTGLFGEDTVTGVTMAYGTTPNTNTTGTFAINVTAANAGTNYEVAYTAGTLTVSNRPVVPSNPTYKVEDETPENSDGSVTIGKDNAQKGEKVTITVTPDSYYKTDKVIVKDKNGNELEVTANENGTYSFVMPAGEVTIEAVFSWDNPFVDVKEDTYYTDAVEWALKNGITEGTSETTFSPDADCSRAQMVTFLWRAAGSPEPTNTDCPFTDVDMDSYYGKAVLWAVEKGITNGTSDTTFSPDMECSRAQMAAFLCRMADGEAVSDESSFTDIEADAYYAESVQWAVENGITEGTGDNKYSPDAVCSRGQMVTFLYRYYN